MRRLVCAPLAVRGRSSVPRDGKAPEVLACSRREGATVRRMKALIGVAARLGSRRVTSKGRLRQRARPAVAFDGLHVVSARVVSRVIQAVLAWPPPLLDALPK